MVHPGIEAGKLPNKIKIDSEIENAGKSIQPPWARMNPSPPENFLYVLNAFSNSQKHAKNSLRDLSPEEIIFLRQVIPQTITWHDVLKPPFGADEKKRIDIKKWIEENILGLPSKPKRRKKKRK